MDQGNDSRIHHLQQQMQESQRLLTDADARAADCAAEARALKEANDRLTEKLRDEVADRRRADADKLKLAEVVRSLMMTNEQLMSRDTRSVSSLPSPRDRSARPHSPHYLTSTFSASEHARLASKYPCLHPSVYNRSFVFLSLFSLCSAPHLLAARVHQVARRPGGESTLRLNCSKFETRSKTSCAC
jgi:hypothetical protein